MRLVGQSSNTSHSTSSGYVVNNQGVNHTSVLENLITNGPAYGAGIGVAGGSGDYEPAPPALAEALKASGEDEVRLFAVISYIN